MAGRPRARSDDQLLDATLRVIGRAGVSGVSGVTFAAVGREAGCAGSSVHERFGSKRALLLALTARMRPPRPREDLPPGQALVELLSDAAAVLADRDAFPGHLTFLQLDLADPEFGAHARRYTLELRATIAELLTAAGHHEPQRLAPVVHAAQQGALLLWALDGEGDAVERVRTAVETTLGV